MIPKVYYNDTSSFKDERLNSPLVELKKEIDLLKRTVKSLCRSDYKREYEEKTGYAYRG